MVANPAIEHAEATVAMSLQRAHTVHLVPGGRFLVRQAIEHLFERGDEAERVIEEIEGQLSHFLAWVQSRD